VSQLQRPFKKSYPIWLWPNLIGLDAPIIAITWQKLFANSFNTKIPVSNYVTLFFVVWVIYSVDRLMDSKSLGNKKTAASRHRFYFKHFRLMLLITLICSGYAGYLCFAVIPFEMLKTGLVVSPFVLVYLLHRKWSRGPILVVFPKEIFVGLVFAIGATLPGHVWAGDIPEAFLSSPVIVFGVLCSMNCIAISVWERDSDYQNDSSALPQFFPIITKFFTPVSWVVFIGLLIFLNYSFGKNYYNESLPVITASSIGCGIIAIISHFDGRVSCNIMRLFADMAVLIPGLAFIIA
tara:strand:- start:56 stop:934 length:879 start_codon:yes stop_codon:yes gene_type:complete